MGLISELRRRNVLRMAVLYAIAAWLIVQVAEVLIDLANLPDQIGLIILGLLAIGFPIALIFSWFYEITPEGISLEKDVDPAISITHVTGRRLDFIFISLLCAAVILFAYDKWWIGGPPEKSIAVLPFTNMSDDPEQEYFSDGLTEELLNLLAGIDELKVAARTSSFFYKDKRDKVTLTEIAKQLDVAHVLEGSVRKSGDKIRVTAQLIKTDDGFHLWSNTYDRTLDDIFLIQDEISAAVVGALKITLLGEAPHARVTNTEAYELTLRGKYFFKRRAEGDLDRARDYFERAVELDPGIADAWVGLVPLYTWASDPPDVPRAKAAAEKALALEPNNPEAHIRMALVYTYEGHDDIATKELYEALKLGPDNPLVLSVHAGIRANAGDLEGAIEFQRRAVSVDPLSATNLNNLAAFLESTGRLDEALAANNKLEELNPGNVQGRKLVGRVRLQQGYAEEALEVFQSLPEDWEKLYYLSLAHYSLGNLEASNATMVEYEEKYSSEHPQEMAGMYAWRGEPDPAFLWLDRARAVKTYDLGNIFEDSFLRNLHSDPRWDVYVNKLRSAD